MTVETTRMDDFRDQFPVGMRVLAVDDDPTCLMVLETLLRRCQYHVTTTNQAITALNLLRENKDKFDLVISDVHMPDMDGFKLLELVGLEMDLPVIMLSAYGDTKLVMKGITHGACDYLLKPVRMEELKNIWQHVIRRKKFDSNNQDKPHSGSDNGLGSAGTSNTDQKMTKKRKDHDEDEDEDPENEDPATQKKRRVVWTGELHRKFVAAVHHLGIDKAVPKKILDLMNVENLTRENVASHLQKFRLYLKRISCMTNQQANLVAALGTPDQSYLRMNSLSGLRQFQNNSLRSFSPAGVIGRFNIAAGLGVHGLPSSRNFQLAHAQNFNNSMNDPLSFHSTTIHGSSIQGISMCALPDQLQHHKSNINSVHDLTDGVINDKTIFPITSEPPDPTITGRSFRNTQFSVDSQDSEFCLSQLDYGRCSDNWSDAVQSSRSIHANSYPPSGCSRQIALPPTPTDAASSIALLSAQSRDACSQEAIFMNPTRNISSNVPPFQGWDDRNQDATYHSNSDVFRSSMNSMIPVNDAVANLDFNFGGVANSAEEILLKQNEGYIMGPQKAEQSCFSNIQGSNQGSLDFEDLVTEMLKQDHQDELKLLDGDFLCNNYSPGISM